MKCEYFYPNSFETTPCALALLIAKFYFVFYSEQCGRSEERLATTVCRRLASLIALRGGLPRHPGPPDATPETVSAIIAELGGPTNLARLTGLTDDLLNNCVGALQACSRLTEAAGQLSVQMESFRASFVDDSTQQSGVEDDIMFASYGTDRLQVRKIKVRF